ncbi:MAG: hypothetical protein H7Y18_00315 [Clostridiaceae bacterium]|nr:hypothetical protein [Clostridiaceae bacterium]
MKPFETSEISAQFFIVGAGEFLIILAFIGIFFPDVYKVVEAASECQSLNTSKAFAGCYFALVPTLKDGSSFMIYL